MRENTRFLLEEKSQAHVPIVETSSRELVLKLEIKVETNLEL